MYTKSIAVVYLDFAGNVSFGNLTCLTASRNVRVLLVSYYCLPMMHIERTNRSQVLIEDMIEMAYADHLKHVSAISRVQFYATIVIEYTQT